MSEDRNRSLHVLVVEKKTEASIICSFDLRPLDGKALPPFSAGAHIDVQLPNGMLRQYSLVNDPSERHRYVIAVLREPASRGGSKSMHDAVQKGHALEVSYPRNNFSLSRSKAGSVLLAGGIGVTPILCMARQLHSTGGDFAMHYFSRSKDRTAFLEDLRAAPFTQRVSFYFDDNDDTQKLDVREVLANADKTAALYVCGPAGFIQTALRQARHLGWPESLLHCEFFSPVASSIAQETAFQVKLACSDITATVEEDQSIVDALAKKGIEIPTSCEHGICTTCLTRVLDGIPDHRDKFLSVEEHKANDQMLPCCSRSRSRLLVLDL